jgi:hypothetical protein
MEVNSDASNNSHSHLQFTPYGTQRSKDRDRLPKFSAYSQLLQFFHSFPNLKRLDVIVPNGHIRQFKKILKRVHPVLFPNVIELSTRFNGVWLNQQCPLIEKHTLAEHRRTRRSHNHSAANLNKCMSEIAKSPNLKTLETSSVLFLADFFQGM